MNIVKSGFVSEFYHNFGNIRHLPIVLYGVGQFTKQIVEQMADFCIIGLMDAKTTGQTIYGLKVLSEQEVADAAKVIIIVSNLSVAERIYQRIESFTKERSIEVYFLNGLKPQAYDTHIGDNPYWEKNEDTLKKRIQENDVVSFDIFDTLLMRRCKNREDVFRFVAHETGIKCSEEEFAAKRKAAEKTCYQNVTKYFQLWQIYDILCQEGVVAKYEAQAALQKEIEIEKRILVPRKSMCAALKYARKQGKTVILTSDMYLDKKAMSDILVEFGICEYDELLISCEVKQDKYWGGMWEYVTSCYPGRKVLHVGDGEIADEKTVREHGIEPYRIASANALLEMSDIARWLGQGRAAGDGILWGLFSARAVNDPFCMGRTKGKLYIADMYEFGYLFAGPLILNYLLWLIKITEVQHIDTILFVSRDGYLLEKLYQKLICKKQGTAPTGIYFLASRRASSVASIEGEEDICFVFDKLCGTASVKYERILERGFGIQIDQDDRYLGSTLYEVGKEILCQHTLERYALRILENARQERDNYIKYLSELKLKGELGFVNFVCRGVTQHCIAKMTRKRIKGFYFASEEDILDIYPHIEDIFCRYGENLSTHTSKLNLVSKYLYGETILSAPDGQLVCFSEDGQPIFEERRKDFAQIQACHRGIEQYMEDALNMIPDIDEALFSNEQIDYIWGAFELKNVILPQAVREAFCFEDYYGE